MAMRKGAALDSRYGKEGDHRRGRPPSRPDGQGPRPAIRQGFLSDRYGVPVFAPGMRKATW